MYAGRSTHRSSRTTLNRKGGTEAVEAVKEVIQYWARTYGLDDSLIQDATLALQRSASAWAAVDRVSALNFAKVLDAFRAERVSESDFAGTTGYGYGDAGRERLDRIYARIFDAESALVRWQIVSGTHAISLAISALTKEGDEIVSLTGLPHDTVRTVLDGISRRGVRWRAVYVDVAGSTCLREVLTEKTKLCLIQRSAGYDSRPSMCIGDMAKLIRAVKETRPDIVCMVDNCYGELVETKEPTSVGADIAAGSLIKNLGGGLAPTGGYVVGKRDFIDEVKDRLTAPGLGGEVGPTLGMNRLLYQGLFLAPHVVGEAVKGAIFLSALFEVMGYDIRPKPESRRTDIVQAIDLGTPGNVRAFCEAVQSASPVDSYVKPEEGELPGYPDRVIMAAGTFIQGASIEFSADAPMRHPYTVYVQGGLIKEQAILAGLLAAKKIGRKS